jgi:hypothetical protein
VRRGCSHLTGWCLRRASGLLRHPSSAWHFGETLLTLTRISVARSENTKYSGGLVKALIDSRIATLEQTKAMLEQQARAYMFSIKSAECAKRLADIARVSASR